MFAEDLSPFFSTADFAVEASAYNAHGVLLTFGVIFDAATDAQLAGLVADASPRAICQTASVPDVILADGITIAGKAYTVANIAHDGTGITTLSLREA
jgi:hypothetical protein